MRRARNGVLERAAPPAGTVRPMSLHVGIGLFTGQIPARSPRTFTQEFGGYAERAVRRAGRVADGYITDAGPVDEVGPTLLPFDEAARGAGKDPHGLGLALLQNVFVSKDGDAWGIARPGVAHQLGAYSAWDAGADTPENDALEPVPPDDETMRKWTPAGTPQEVVTALRPLVEAFGDRQLHLVVRLHYPGMAFDVAARAVELFGREVLPALRGS